MESISESVGALERKPSPSSPHLITGQELLTGKCRMLRRDPKPAKIIPAKMAGQDFPLIFLSDISKNFPGVQALKKVDLHLKKGEVLGLVGENGAGKSTLMKILAGVHQKNEGQIFFRGSEIQFKNPHEAIKAGISTVYQDLNLVEELNICENIFLGRFIKSRLGLIDQKEMEKIAREGRGVLLYMRQEGRGIGFHNKIRAYALQDTGMDTVEANLCLGFDADLRDYGIGAQILVDLGLHQIRLMTNNPKKVIGLEGYGLEVKETLPIVTPPNPHNLRYLKTKQKKLGHTLNVSGSTDN